jgi:hypothetical protein
MGLESLPEQPLGPGRKRALASACLEAVASCRAAWAWDSPAGNLAEDSRAADSLEGNLADSPSAGDSRVGNPSVVGSPAAASCQAAWDSRAGSPSVVGSPEAASYQAAWDIPAGNPSAAWPCRAAGVVESELQEILGRRGCQTWREWDTSWSGTDDGCLSWGRWKNSSVSTTRTTAREGAGGTFFFEGR